MTTASSKTTASFPSATSSDSGTTWRCLVVHWSRRMSSTSPERSAARPILFGTCLADRCDDFGASRGNVGVVDRWSGVVPERRNTEQVGGKFERHTILREEKRPFAGQSSDEHS